MDDQETVLKQVFGESSDSDSNDCEQPQQHEIRSENLGQIPSWLHFKVINGLYLCRDFLSPQDQSSLLSAVQNEGWFTDASHNQAMRFGDLPTWAIKLSNSIREAVLLSDNDLASCDGDKEACPLASDLLWREPLFDQLIVNVYQPGEGICAHVDLMRFDDGIAIVSLESSCVMHFTRVREGSSTGKRETEDPPAEKVPVYLTPGSLVVMSGEARYHWKHEITRKPGFQIWQGEELNQKRRTSITLRKLCRVD
ncbi:alkylated DNA repair protein ALKBH8 homolog [Mangifera indica]|uniref:alkylated DNA repair protein ALKBH8 homolog n=1 Tax=Mangifera indica TaxID=29780 RepID=UPI001CFA78F5|nr:alkylated DNA repair protein ALKBH8 homolog [Mangifera indica]